MTVCFVMCTLFVLVLTAWSWPPLFKVWWWLKRRNR